MVINRVTRRPEFYSLDSSPLPQCLEGFKNVVHSLQATHPLLTNPALILNKGRHVIVTSQI